MNSFAFAFLLGQLLFMIAFILFSFINYKSRFKSDYDFRNHFPYELNYESKFKDNLIGNICLIISSTCGLAFYATFNTTYNNGYLIFAMIGGMINIVLSSILFFAPLKALRVHLGVAVFNIVLSFLVPIAFAFAASIDYSQTKNVSSLIMVILNSIICLIVFILVMNPKLSRWADLDKKENKDGTVTYARPKYFVLAFTEWLLYFLTIIVEIMAILTRFYIA